MRELVKEAVGSVDSAMVGLHMKGRWFADSKNQLALGVAVPPKSGSPRCQSIRTTKN